MIDSDQPESMPNLIRALSGSMNKVAIYMVHGFPEPVKSFITFVILSQRATCIKGLFWPPYEAYIKIVFHQCVLISL